MSAMQFGKTDINIQNKIHTMKMTKTKLAKGFTLVELLVVIAIIAALAALSTPVVLKQQKKASLAEAINNQKQIGYLMKDWDNQYGTYPETVNTNDGSSITVADANTLFRKFAEFSLVSSEEVFYAKLNFNKKPDGYTAALTDFLKAGECGFGYITNLNGSKPARCPVTIAPLDAATGTALDGEAFGGSAAYLCVDGSVQTGSINLSGVTFVNQGTAGAAVSVLDFTNTNIYGDVTTAPALLSPSGVTVPTP